MSSTNHGIPEPVDYDEIEDPQSYYRERLNEMNLADVLYHWPQVGGSCVDGLDTELDRVAEDLANEWKTL